MSRRSENRGSRDKSYYRGRDLDERYPREINGHYPDRNLNFTLENTQGSARFTPEQNLVPAHPYSNYPRVATLPYPYAPPLVDEIGQPYTQHAVENPLSSGYLGPQDGFSHQPMAQEVNLGPLGNGVFYFVPSAGGQPIPIHPSMFHFIHNLLQSNYVEAAQNSMQPGFNPDMPFQRGTQNLNGNPVYSNDFFERYDEWKRNKTAYSENPRPEDMQRQPAFERRTSAAEHHPIVVNQEVEKANPGRKNSIEEKINTADKLSQSLEDGELMQKRERPIDRAEPRRHQSRSPSPVRRRMETSGPKISEKSSKSLAATAQASEKPSEENGNPCRTLFIRNFTKNVSGNEIKAIFEKFGSVKEVNTTIHQLKGIIFVSFHDIRDAKVAYKKMQGKKIDDRKVFIVLKLVISNFSDRHPL